MRSNSERSPNTKIPAQTPAILHVQPFLPSSPRQHGTAGKTGFKRGEWKHVQCFRNAAIVANTVKLRSASTLKHKGQLVTSAPKQNSIDTKHVTNTSPNYATSTPSAEICRLLRNPRITYFTSSWCRTTMACKRKNHRCFPGSSNR